MKIAIIDNYDSFTYNLAHAVNALGAETAILRNDRFKLPDIEKYDKLILSPGPDLRLDADVLSGASAAPAVATAPSVVASTTGGSGASAAPPRSASPSPTRARP